MYMIVRRVSRQRHPWDHLTNRTRIEKRMRRLYNANGPLRLPERGSAYRRCEVKNGARAKWRKFDWCMSRVCNRPYRR